MSNLKTILKNEITKVQSELIIFRDEYLPIFLGPPSESWWSQYTHKRTDKVLDRLLSWQRGITVLCKAFPLCVYDENVKVPMEKDFRKFIFDSDIPEFERLEDGIRWKISLPILVWSSCYCYGCPCIEKKEPPEDWEQVFLARLPQIKDWIMGISVKDSRHPNAIGSILPYIANIDPAFAKRALNLDTWRSIVNSNSNLSKQEKQALLEEIDSFMFSYYVNAALRYNLTALGNNHFLSIRDYFDHLCLYGFYTGRIPHFLFALLLRKVSILKQLAREEAEKGGTT